MTLCKQSCRSPRNTNVTTSGRSYAEVFPVYGEYGGQSRICCMNPCRELKQNPEVVVPPGYEHLVEPAQYNLVEKARVKWHVKVREFLRSETGLKLSVAGKQYSVQIAPDVG